ncbi:Uma2 family endonuclease [Fimbriimonas ginsengisoli]|nr:Uma2 family endonuclease [Fimbriimonas ginsengisoli]
MPSRTWTSPADYLAAERLADQKHELINGEVYAMSGVSRWHALIVANFVRRLGNRFEGRNCNVVSSDLRVRIPATDAYLYPDVVVYCGEGQWLDEAFDTLENPIVVVEVLSPSTDRYDRVDKFRHYRKIESLQAYIIVAQDSLAVEHHARQENGEWLMTEYDQPSQSLVIPSLGLELPLTEIYDHIEMPG